MYGLGVLNFWICPIASHVSDYASACKFCVACFHAKISAACGHGAFYVLANWSDQYWPFPFRNACEKLKLIVTFGF